MSQLLPLLKDEEVLEIDHNSTLEYDIKSELRLRAVIVYGALEFTPTNDTKLVVGDLIVAPTGRLTVGTENHPIASDKKAEIVLADYAFDRNTDPYQLRNAIIALGEVTMHGRPIINPGIRLAQAPKAGDRSLLLNDIPKGWRQGDTVVLADTRQLPKQNKNFFSQTEYVTVAAIDGLRVVLDRDLSFAHPGILLPDIRGNLTVPIQIEAINTTRNVVVRSLEPVGIRGHTMFADRARVDLRYASFVDLGRTASGELNNTQCNENGDLLRFGSNQIGRYPIHAHFLLGRENPSNQGYQFTMLGLNVEGSRRWAVAIHDSSFGLISNNVLRYEAANMRIISENASAVLANSEGAVDSNGIFAGTYVANFHVGFDSLRHARNTARPGAFSPESVTEVRGGMWRNWINFRINLALDHVARVTRIGEVATDAPSEMKPIPGLSAQSLNVLMNYDQPNITGMHVLTKDKVFLENWAYSNLTAPNFRIYFLQQNPDFIVPQSSIGPVRIFGASEANLTNETHRVRYGSSIGGDLAPCGGRGISCAELQSRGQSWRIHGLTEDRP